MEPIINSNIQKYLQSLDEFTNDQLVVSDSRFQDEMGSFLYQKRDGEQVKIIPPVYTKNADKRRLIEEEKNQLDLKLQFARNNLALMENPEQKFKNTYNDQVTRSEKVEYLLKQYDSTQKELQDLKSELQDLQLQNNLLLKTEYKNGKLVKSGSLVNLAKQLKDLTSELNTTVEGVFPERKRPQLYELNKVKIPETEKGVKLRLAYDNWRKLAEEYNTELQSYKSTLQKLEKMEGEILALISVNKFNLEEGNPAIESSRQQYNQQIQPKLPTLEEHEELEDEEEQEAQEEQVQPVSTSNKTPKQIFIKPSEDKLIQKTKIKIIPRKK